MMSTSTVWHRVAGVDTLPEGRVATVTAGHRTLALTQALENDGPALVEVMSDPKLI